MRKRFPISTHQEFPQALAAKKAKIEESPDKEFQIRRFKDGFRLVERLSSTEAALIQNLRKPKKRKGSTYVPQ